MASSDESSGYSQLCLAGLIVACLIIGYIYAKNSTSGMMGNYSPWISGSDLLPTKMPVVSINPYCTKCKYTLVGKTCPRCGACPNCRAEDKCGECQMFPRQVSLEEKKLPCSVCGRKNCVCVSSTGRIVEKEPGVARNGVFSDIVSSSFRN